MCIYKLLFTFPHTFTPASSLLHSHTHTLTFTSTSSNSHILTSTLSHFHTLTLTYPHIPTPSHSHTPYPHTLTSTLSHSHTGPSHSHTLTPPPSTFPQARAPHSPVIIVGTHLDKLSSKSQKTELTQSLEYIASTYGTDENRKEGFPQVRRGFPPTVTESG